MSRAHDRSIPFRPAFRFALPALLLAACTVVGRDHETPQAEVPAEWREQSNARIDQSPAELAAWWTQLGDPTLDRLVERAVSQGLDLRVALSRVREARALRGVAASDQWPTLDARASYQRREESANTAFGEFVPDEDLYTVGFDATWELDVWGRVRRSVEAADADLDATMESARDVAVTVAAETARNYVELRSFQRRLEIARTNVSLQEQTLQLVRARFDSGLVGERDVAQAATSVESTRSRVPTFEAGLRAAENRLAVLLGLTPGALAAELAEPAPVPRPPARVAVGVPTDVVRQRADVRRAERTLAAEVARVGVAEGDLYPRFTLAGSLGLASDGSSNLFEDESKALAFGPFMRWNVFDAGRIRNTVAAQDERAEQAYLAWEQTVLAALEEAENAMTSFVREEERRGSLAEAAAQSRRAVELARTEYTEGLSDFQSVLDSQRALAVLEDELAASDAAITTDLVSLYKALGGGFEGEDFAARLAAAEEPGG